jgi:2-methylisocitrate lyase-like PEP mutase family enzyme
MDHSINMKPTDYTPQPAAARLRSLLRDDQGILVCPGVYDGLTARIALAQGFRCLYMTGAGTAASRLGMPDLGLVTMNDMLTNAAMLASLDRTVPLIADADTGYGGPLMVARTVKGYIAAGVAGMHIEDQVLAKRCGHLGGKQIVAAEEFYGRIRAAVEAREEERRMSGGDIVIIARTDALQSHGLDEAVARLQACADIGADVLFLEGVTSKDQARETCARLKEWPTILNMVGGGSTPAMSAVEAQQLGYRIMIFPGIALTAVLDGVSHAYRHLHETGTAPESKGDEEFGVKRLFNTVGLQQCLQFDKLVGGKAYETI